MGAPLLLLPSAPACCSCVAGPAAGPRKLAATVSSPSSAASTLRLRPSGRRWGRACVARAGGRGDGDGVKSGGAEFFGEDGVVEDMDGYLNYLSLEYDSVWDTKPAWCQPWTILLTGTIAVSISWVLIQSIVITSGVSFIICAWWYIFLYSYPKAYAEMIAERRRKVASGAEDTYGMEKIHFFQLLFACLNRAKSAQPSQPSLTGSSPILRMIERSPHPQRQALRIHRRGMRAAVRARRPQRPPPSPETRAKAEQAPGPLTVPLRAFKLRLRNGSPLALTAKTFKSYAETCAALLRLCRTTTAVSSNAPASSVPSALPLVTTLHAHALRSGLAADRSVASNLLTAYAAFARTADRDRAFGDCVAAGAASSFTYDFMVSEYVKAGDIVSARTLFDGMPDRSVVSSTTMVDALMKRGSVSEALDLYKRCTLRSVAFFTAMIAGFVRNELHRDALPVFREMLSCSVRPNVVTLICVIKACSGAGEFDLAMSMVGLAIKWNLFEKSIEVHNSLITLYLRMGDAAGARRIFDEMEVRDVVSWTALLDVYAELGDLEGARRVLDAMPERNEVSWGTLIARHEQKGDAAEAVRLYNQMLADSCRPNISCFSSVLSACATLRDSREGTRIHANALKMGSSTNVFVSSSLIDMYCKCKQCTDALKIFSSLQQKNVVCWNSLISGYSWNGKMVEAEELFKKMPSRNAASWNAIISGYAENGQFVDALKSFSAMLASGQAPGKITFSSVLLACANLCSLEMGKMAHAKIVKLGIEDNVFMGTALSDMYAKSGDLESSKRVFYLMPEKNDVSWTAMVQGLAENGFAEDSILLFENMMTAGIVPSEHTFLAVLFACSHSGFVKQAIHYFETMKAHGILPKEKHYTCMVDVLARAGRLTEAEELLMRVPSKSQASSWSALLSACNTYRNKEIGERAAKKLNELEKDNTSGYVLLSNMYASCGKWKDAAEMRILMKGASLKKDGGCSWLQLRGQYYAFFSWDAKHPMSLEIYEILDLLMWESTT
ncbi:hypothetical protein EJB05_05003 [Eragrostis curvula]|uniref:Pentacotripeptide-repeat region of PRORP domain-containing protein n=1 Tax=Eragrostis curvula TaxID=38414 RepID=A0A5J9WE20_9POAL|nr:hypothetical protein EJB05_05003 [Eragrostis curvula]